MDESSARVLELIQIEKPIALQKTDIWVLENYLVLQKNTKREREREREKGHSMLSTNIGKKNWFAAPIQINC